MPVAERWEVALAVAEAGPDLVVLPVVLAAQDEPVVPLVEAEVVCLEQVETELVGLVVAAALGVAAAHWVGIESVALVLRRLVVHTVVASLGVAAAVAAPAFVLGDHWSRACLPPAAP